MKLEISVPSKTFLLGEYNVLAGNSALLINTLPRFKLIIKNNNDLKNNFNIKSNNVYFLNDYVKRHAKYFQNLSLEYVDPHHNQGGFGNSSAQFILPVICRYYLHRLNLSTQKILTEYQRMFESHNHYKPSGADVISQLFGKVVFFNKNKNIILNYSWPFQDLAFFLIKTDYKINTSQHLMNLNNLDTKYLDEVAKEAIDCINNNDSNEFCYLINEYAKRLNTLNLVLPEIREILAKITAIPYVLAAKGCGALGADVVLVVANKKNTLLLEKRLLEDGYKLIASEQQISTGYLINNMSRSKICSVPILK